MLRAGPLRRAQYDIHASIPVEIVPDVDAVTQSAHYCRHLAPRPASLGDATLIGDKPQFRLGQIDAGNRAGAGAGQVFANEIHAGARGREHGIHVAALNIELDIAATAEPVEDAPLVGIGHRVREAGQDLGIHSPHEFSGIVRIHHIGAGECERAEHAHEITGDGKLGILGKVGFEPRDDRCGEFLLRRRDALSWRQHHQCEHPALLAFREIVRRW